MQKGVYKLTGLIEGEDHWYYVKPTPVKKALLDKALKEGKSLLPEAYGEVLAWGYGKEPPLYYREQFEDV